MAKLSMCFYNNNDYEKAIEFFINESDFYCDACNNEFRTLYFEVDDSEDANSLEPAIIEELIWDDVNIDYYFEFND